MPKEHNKSLIKKIEGRPKEIAPFKYPSSSVPMMMQALIEEIFIDILPDDIKHYYLKKAYKIAHDITRGFCHDDWTFLTQMVLRQRMQLKPPKPPTIRDCIKEMKSNLKRFITKS